MLSPIRSTITPVRQTRRRSTSRSTRQTTHRVAFPDSITVPEDADPTPVEVLDDASDVDGDALTILGKTNGSKGSAVITGGGTGLTYTPNPNANGSDSFTYTISDGHGGVDTATVAVTIIAVDDPPVAAPDSVTVGQSGPPVAVSVLANDSDPENDTRTITGKTDGTHGVVVITGGGTGLTYQPTAGYLGSDTFTYTIDDGHGGTAVGMVSVTVAVNHVPNAANDAGLTVPESAGATTLAVKANDTDADGDTLTITGKTNGAHGTVTITGGGTGLAYDPNQLYIGTDVFTYTISDGRGGSRHGGRPLDRGQGHDQADRDRPGRGLLRPDRRVDHDARPHQLVGRRCRDRHRQVPAPGQRQRRRLQHDRPGERDLDVDQPDADELANLPLPRPRDRQAGQRQLVCDRPGVQAGHVPEFEHGPRLFRVMDHVHDIEGARWLATATRAPRVRASH